MSDELTTVQVMALIIAAYPRQAELPDATIDVYCELLADIPPETLKAAALKHVGESQWFPTVAELRRASLSIVERADGTKTAGEAWHEVTRAISQIGSYRTPEFSSPVIQTAVDSVGGWRELCMSENTVADRARFIQAYDTLRKREQEDRLMLPEVAELVKALSVNGGPKALSDGRQG